MPNKYIEIESQIIDTPCEAFLNINLVAINKKIKVSNTKDLFKEFQFIINKAHNLGHIIQNDMILEGRAEVWSWMVSVDETLSELQLWKTKVRDYMWQNEISDEEAQVFQKLLDTRYETDN